MIETVLITLAAPILSDRLWPNVATEGCARPYGVYQEIVSPPTNTLADGVPIRQSIMQIDIYDTTYLGARTASDAMAAAIESAFISGTLVGVQHTRRSLYEPETKLHRVLYEYSFWY
jgi:hypothetical protein